MMDKTKKYLSDILIAISLIEDFTKDINTFEKYSDDLKTQSAVERQLGIIGEAVNKFQKEKPNTELKNARQIIAFRNRLIHTYDSLDNSIVWSILQRHIPSLKNEIMVLNI